MRRAWMAGACLALAGCGNALVEGCESFIKSGLRSPATYRLISSQQRDAPISIDELRRLGGARPGALATELRRSGMTAEANELEADARTVRYGLHTVSISYDADNAFGVPIRSAQICAFETRDGEKPSKEAVAIAVRNAEVERGTAPTTGYTCCLR